LVFGTGTIAGMMLMTTAIAAPVAYASRRTTIASGFLTQISGLISAGFGLFLVYQFTVVDGLFSGHVHWTPH
jgi:high-affinity nickel-transport protein